MRILLIVIPIMVPKLPSFEVLSPFLREIDQSHIYSNYGPMTWKLRLAYSEYLKVEPELIVPLANATLAIQGSLEILQPLDWIIPDYTFAATAHAAVSAKKNVYLADVDCDNYQLQIPNEVDPKDFGIIPVMPFGSPVDFEKWQGFPALVIDAAASLGSPPPDFQKMPDSSIVIYSLHATKVLGCGEGALAVCSSVEQAVNLQTWSNFGFYGSRSSSILGTNAKMSEMSAAVALCSLLNLETEQSEWSLVSSYIRNLSIPERFNTKVQDYPGFNPYWIISALNLDERLKIENAFHQENIQTRCWWSSRISDMPPFSNLKKIVETENSKNLAETQLGLPFWRGISLESINKIGQVLIDFDMKFSID